VVLSTITHLNGYVLRIWLEGMALPLEPTDTHRLYSEDRCDWVPAGKLAGGDRLRTLHGPAEITRIDSKPGVHRVYNIEVETEHCYYVSTAGILSHNVNPCANPPDVAALIKLAKEAKRSGRAISRAEADNLLTWADEYGVLSRGPEHHPERGFNELHIHIGPVNHIRVSP